jgi:hypothetical protein
MNPDPAFRVPLSGAVATLLRRLHDEAAEDGRRDAFLSALRTITNRLRTDPNVFGEEHYNLPGLGLTVRVAVVLPLSVKFTVHPGRRLVTVGTFRYVQPG